MEMSDLRSQDLQNAGPAPPAYMARSCRPGGGAYEEAEATSAKLAGAEGGLTTVRGLAHSDLFQITPHRVRMGKADRKSTRLNSSHVSISYAVFCLKKK